MNMTAGAILVSMLFVVGTAGASYAADTTRPLQGSDHLKVIIEGTNTAPQGGTPSPVVIGQLLKIDGNIYVVKDHSGKEVHFQLDERTRMDTRPQVGDQIMANVEPQGYAYSIDKAN